MYEHILSLLPPQAADAVRGFGENNLCEIRLRAGRPVAVTTPAANVALKAVCSAREIAATVDRMCGGSLHAYEETIKNGYIPSPEAAVPVSAERFPARGYPISPRCA